MLPALLKGRGTALARLADPFEKSAQHTLAGGPMGVFAGKLDWLFLDPAALRVLRTAVGTGTQSDHAWISEYERNTFSSSFLFFESPICGIARSTAAAQTSLPPNHLGERPIMATSLPAAAPTKVGCGCGCPDCRCLAPPPGNLKKTKVDLYGSGDAVRHNDDGDKDDETAALLLSSGAVARRCACCCARCQHDTRDTDDDDDECNSDDQDDDDNEGSDHDQSRGEVVVAVWPVACGGCAAVVRSVAERRLALAGYPPTAPKGKGKAHAQSASTAATSRVRVGEGGHAAVRVELYGGGLDADEAAREVGRALVTDLRGAGFTSAEVVPHADAAPLLPTPSRPSLFSAASAQAARRPAFLFSVQVRTTRTLPLLRWLYLIACRVVSCAVCRDRE